MPRKVAPDYIRIGPGKSVPETTTIQLNPTGGVEGDWSEYIRIADGAITALNAHIQTPKDAHPASAVGVTAPEGTLPDNAQEAFNELYSGASRKPPELGVLAWYPSRFGIPDWGVLKLGDGRVLDFTGNHPSTQNDASAVYPYYMVSSNPSLDWEAFYRYSFLYDPATGIVSTADRGKEIAADPIWNNSNVAGGGAGLTRAGAYTKDAGSVTRTIRILPQSIAPEDYREVCVSGIIFPADRGVLALVHWPAEGDVTAFLAQGLTERCVAALLLGAGVRDGVTFDTTGEYPSDGEPGGIFCLGFDANDDYDPFAYPGRASGQYDLLELELGISLLDGSPLPAQFVAAPRVVDSVTPTAGQVRLGTDPASGVPNESPYGIPVLGAGAAAYVAGSFGTVNGKPTVGQSFVVGGTVQNFLSYRLPVLDSYKALSGCKYTPRGMNPYATKELARYLIPQSLYDLTASPDSFDYIDGNYYLKQAGNYDWEDPQIVDRLGPDYWTWQLARYRHSFYIAGSNASDVKVGTYWILHFKTEHNFEQFVRDGVLPGDATDGYELYGAYPFTGVESYGNVVNEDDSTATPPRGPAPDYGYSAKEFWANRSSVYIADKLNHIDSLINTAEYSWSADPTGVMWCSGVAYFTPRLPAGGDSFQFTDLTVEVLAANNPWTQGYRTDDNPLTGDPGTDPAVINSPNPAFLFLGPFSNDPAITTYTVTGTLTDSRGEYPQRVEFPFTQLGAFTANVGPTAGDDLVAHLNGTITLQGDATTPSFSADARVRAFIRRPLGPEAGWEYAALPWHSPGHGTYLSPLGGETFLFHSTSFDTVAQVGSYGNFVDGGSVGYSALFTADKDVYERFLDEMYRYEIGWGTGGTASQRSYLVGPGMAGWAGGVIAVSVQAGSTASTWKDSSWVQGTHNETSLLVLTSELQVAGLPHRNPPLSDWVMYPYPSAGILLYPKDDYTNNYRPDLANEVITQFDYSAATGTRSYVRAFDAAFSRSVSPADVAGTPYVYLRLDGVVLQDFRYNPPGPGNTVSGVSIQLKVPGFTTWMDLGRRDGDGPSKQDPNLDGAGCLVIGEYTYDCVDGDTGLAYCQVKAHIGPAATLAYGDGDEIPVLIKVVMQDPATPTDSTKYDLNTEADPYPTYGWTGSTGSSLECSRVRGLVGIRLIHPESIQSNPEITPEPPV